MSGAADPPRSHGLGGFEETLKDFWLTRPRRPLRGRKVAGVAAAIGNRYGIDPVIVRVAFVAATVFGGVGLSLYVLGWLFFPAEGDQVSAIEALFGKGRSSMTKGFTIILAIAFFPLSSWAFAGGWFDGGGVIGLALLVTALYLLHRGRGQFNRPEVPETTMYSMSTPASTAAEQPGWDPLAAPPLAWDLPSDEPPPPPAPPAPRRPARVPRRRSKIGLVTFACALLVAGAGAAAAATGADWFSAGHIIGLTLGVLGVGLVAGAFAGGGRGLIGLAIPLCIAGVIVTAVPVSDYKGGFGDLNAAPATIAEVQPEYSHTAGDMRLDLTKLPASGTVTTSVHNGAGDTRITVPETADVRFSCDTSAGTVDCLGITTDGVGRPAATGTDLGTDGAGGLQINLTVQQGAGNVEVLRG
ncbi:PspC domain-containing protein [Amycolatopsis acidicola]|uniref:PspC domain-containing protein n=1 Tax=Amycolatopsis acidicola TaxID=2596893 RepID=A0A5N0UP21_9PSEU|nr:PspC domain-containing protein [Amycolatopsis acidicola]KAA9152566.1 PspC domain-containing protein [Amycolatopsis acidicola]